MSYDSQHTSSFETGRSLNRPPQGVTPHHTAEYQHSGRDRHTEDNNCPAVTTPELVKHSESATRQHEKGCHRTAAVSAPPRRLSSHDFSAGNWGLSRQQPPDIGVSPARSLPPQEPGKIRCNSHNQFSRYQRKVTVPLLRRGPVIV